jgi:L-glyceraldehyde 3-phosphate reductase
MEVRRVGNSGLVVPVITLGLMVRDCRAGEAFESVKHTILRAHALGVTSIDLATGYGGGAVELAVGEVLRSEPSLRREGLVLATKAGWADGSRRMLVGSLERSLKQLGVEYVDLYYHHAPDANTPYEETVSAMEQLVRQGKTRYVGVSNYSPAETVRIAPMMKEAGIGFVAHQCNYNMLNRWVEDGLLSVLPALGMSAVFFSVVNQGVLSDHTLECLRPGSRAERSLNALAAGVPTGEPAYGRYKEGDVKEQVFGMLRELSKIARERGQTLSQLAISWALRHQAAATALVGASSAAQIESAAAAAGKLAFTREELVRINGILPGRFGMI